MQSILRVARRLVRSPSLPRQFSNTSYQSIDESHKIEEETWPWYRPEDFYPVRIGEVFNSRYQIVGKLGYGGYGTVWLCRDLIDRRHLTLKIGTCDALSNELNALKYLRTVPTRHDGRFVVRQLVDEFEVANGEHRYQCLIHEPLSTTVAAFRRLLPSKALPLQVCKGVLVHVLLALDFLHTEANIVHTDIQEKNILLGMDKQTSGQDVCQAFEQRELEDPSPRKVSSSDGRVTHTSRRLVPPIYNYGQPVLCDFGEARFGDYDSMVDIQPYQYRAPEIILDMRWNEMVDVWNVGVMISDLLGKGNLFKTLDAEGNESNDVHLAHMVALLGPPPADFLARTATGRAWKWFNEDGTWKGTAKIPSRTLCAEDVSKEDVGNEADFLAFMRKMLQWKPEDRSRPADLLKDPWLAADYLT